MYNMCNVQTNNHITSLFFRYVSTQDWKVKDDWGWTLLHEVAHNGQPDVIQVE